MTDDLWPLPLRRGELDESTNDDDEPQDVPAHDQTELHAVERVVAELVRGASRRTRRQISRLLDQQEDTPK